MKRWTCMAVVLLVLVGCGGGDGGDGNEPVEEAELPEFDLTGRWEMADADLKCQSSSGELPEFALADLNGEFTSELLERPLRIVQAGSSLEITDLESGSQVERTVAGNQVGYAQSERRLVGDHDIDLSLDVMGTAVDQDRVVGTHTFMWTTNLDGLTVAGDTL